MLTTALVALSLAQLPTAQDFIDNTEIGDAKQYIGLRSRGVYEGHAIDKAKGDTVVNGTWKLNGDSVEVKSTGCKGPACKELKKDWSVKIGVAAARAIQTDRYADHGVRTNAEADGDLLDTVAALDDAGRKLLAQAAEAMRLSARGYHRVLRVSRTIADLAGAEDIGRVHIAEALSYRRRAPAN